MGKTVVLVEDEPNIIEAISFILSRDGWGVHTHSNGDTALAALESKAPDLIVLDVMLPGRSGFAMELGASLFMTKPFSNSDVLAAVRELAGA
jgi:DNA-binding response OmpR family regulator